ncbi:hypothetical protein VHEMI08363 [[Torrubiella] hemipterigena]|uniref:Uncharacterized protein n=1 Tax=[Torrubiella] hemipterigena TaxID=1531966 RepID=A0A0A1TN37_9HYPO|nr:hypothetical protein VHEMI08363 [[Torrubiella] hemipterigena]
MTPEGYRQSQKATEMVLRHWSIGLSDCEAACVLDYMTRKQYNEIDCGTGIRTACCRISSIAAKVQSNADIYTCPCEPGSPTGLWKAVENCDAMRETGHMGGNKVIKQARSIAPRETAGPSVIGASLGAVLFVLILCISICIWWSYRRNRKEEMREDRARDLAAVTSPMEVPPTNSLTAIQAPPRHYARKAAAASQPRHPERFPRPHNEIRGYYESGVSVAENASNRREPNGIELQAVRQLPKLA